MGHAGGRAGEVTAGPTLEQGGKGSEGETTWRSGGRMLQAEGAASAGALRRSMLGM